MKGKILRLAAVFLVLPLAIWGYFAFAANSYDINYSGGAALSSDNVTQDESLINSLTPLIKSNDNLSVSFSNSSKWLTGYLNDGRCSEARYAFIDGSKSITSSDNVSFTLSNGKYDIDVKIDNASLETSYPNSGRTYAIAVDKTRTFLYAGWAWLYTDSNCSNTVKNPNNTSEGINGLNLWTSQGDKIFVSTNIKLRKHGENTPFKSNEQYFALTDIDSAQSYKILNSDNLLTKTNMFAKKISDLQEPGNTLKNMFNSNGNYIYSQYDSENKTVVALNSDEGQGTVFVKMKDNGSAQTSGLNTVFGFAVGAGSGIEYYSKEYTVIYQSDSHGSMGNNLKNETVFSGDNPTGSTSVPNAHYHFTNCWKANVAVTVNGSSVAANTCLTPAQVKQVTVNQNITFTAIHEMDKFTVTYKSDSHGSVTGKTSESRDYGTHPTGSSAIPNTGYQATKCWQVDKAVTVNGTNYPANSCLSATQVTDVTVTQDLTFTAIHEIYQYTVTYKSDSHGSMGNNLQSETKNYGDKPTGSTSVPNAHYHFTNCWKANVAVTVNGSSVAANTCLTPAQVKQVTVNQNITFTAIHEINVNITVIKKNSETGECVADFNSNVTFSLVNKTGASTSYNGQTYANGVTVVANAKPTNCQLEWNDLTQYGDYEIQENYSGSSYTVDAANGKQTVNVSSTKPNATVTFTNTPKKGNITINKIDSETNTCDSVLGLTLIGAEFKIYNSTGELIKYKGQIIARDAYIDTASITTKNDGKCQITFENLPYGKYTIKETKTTEGYELNTTPREVTIPGQNGANVSVTFKNQPIRGDLTFTKKDANNDVPMANTMFSISNIDKNDKIVETHIVVTDQNGVINTSSSFIPHSNNTNGYDALYDERYNVPFAGYGTWFGLDSKKKPLSVNDVLGALPYGTYLVEELKCPANTFCYKIKDQKRIFSIKRQGQVVDLGNWDNDCAVFSLETEAIDPKDDDKYVEAIKDTKITDHIKYCARTDKKFVIKGTLVNKATGEPVLVNGKPVESSVEVTPKDECEEVNMNFIFDGTGLGGQDVVVFERLYYDDEMIVAHEDLADEDQTVEMVYLNTVATNKENNEKILPVSESATIKDTVKYCLKPGAEYTLKGTVMNKESGEVLLINERRVEQEIIFTPEESCGELEMFYELNTTGLGGAKLVIINELLREDETILKHHDLDNNDESIDVELPAPNTGAPTEESDFGQITVSVVGVIAGALFVVLPSRFHRKKIGFTKL